MKGPSAGVMTPDDSTSVESKQTCTQGLRCMFPLNITKKHAD